MANPPVPVPRNWTVGETATGAFANSLRDDCNFLLNKPRARVTQVTTATTLTTSVWTVIGMDASVIDTYGGHSNSTNNSRYTAIVAGRYRCVGCVAFAGNITNRRQARLMVTGTPVLGSAVSMNALGSAALTAAQITEADVFLNVGDYVEVAGWQDSGGNLNTLIGATDFGSSLSVTWEATS